MTRSAFALCALAALSLSACEWEGRPDGAPPSNAGAMEYEPSDSYDAVEEIDLNDAEVVEPLTPASATPQTQTVRDAPLNPDVTASDTQLDMNADAGDRDTPASDQ